MNLQVHIATMVRTDGLVGPCCNYGKCCNYRIRTDPYGLQLWNSGTDPHIRIATMGLQISTMGFGHGIVCVATMWDRRSVGIVCVATMWDSRSVSQLWDSGTERFVPRLCGITTMGLGYEPAGLYLNYGIRAQNSLCLNGLCRNYVGLQVRIAIMGSGHRTVCATTMWFMS